MQFLRPQSRGSSRGQGRRVLMTVDAVGGVWTYALDLVQALQPVTAREPARAEKPLFLSFNQGES